MATNGSFGVNFGSYSSAIFSWEAISCSIPNNTTTIKWTLTAKSLNNYHQGTASATIDGNSIGSTTATNGGTTTTTGTLTYSHNGYNDVNFVVELSIRDVINQGTIHGDNTNKGTQTFTIDAIPMKATLTRVDSFNDEEDYKIYYNNPSKGVNSLSVALFTGAGAQLSSYTTLSGISDSAIIPLNENERKKIRSNIGKSLSTRVFVRLKTTITNPYSNETETYLSTALATVTLVNYEPVLNPTVRDANNVTTALTGDNSKFIKYFSTLFFNTGAVANKEAKINSQYIICGSKSKENYTSLTGTFENIDSNTVYFGMTDSRDLTVKDSIVVDLIPYVKLTASLTLEPLSLAGDMRINISGNYYNGSFGAQNNSLQFKYGIRENGGDITWVIIEPTVTYGDNTYEASYTISGLNPNSTYQITANVVDALMNAQSREESITSTPIFDWGKTDFKHNTPVYLTKNLSLRVVDNNGYDVSVFNPCNPNGDLVLGWGQYDKANGDTSVYGNNINLTAKEKIKINGTEIGGKVLWQGEYYMNASQVATLSEPVSQQINGIVLVFSLYRDGYAEDVSLHSFFVSKKEVELMPNAPHTFFLMINSGFSVVGAKYLYIADNAITGDATNAEDGSNNGFTYKNSNFVLRYVIGV